jgi:ABC-type spermidine/putrescine transport system permease subunit I
MIFTLYVSFRNVDPRLRSAAATLGARPLRIFLAITLPLTMPGLVAGSVLVFIGTLGFFVTPALLGGPSEMMLANLITFQVKDALDWPMASTIASLLMLAVASLGWIYFGFMNRTGRARPA